MEYQGRTGLQADALEIVRKRERLAEAKTRRQKRARVHVPDERGDEIRRQIDSGESDALENELAHTAPRFHARRDLDGHLSREKLKHAGFREPALELVEVERGANDRETFFEADPGRLDTLGQLGRTLRLE